MAKFFSRKARPVSTPVLSSDFIAVLSDEFHLPQTTVLSTLRSFGVNTEKVPLDQKDLLREVLACKFHDYQRYQSKDKVYLERLDEELRSFDEIYIDTAPIIQMDWFLHFVADAEPILRRRKKKLLILEKTMEELHGLKDNPEKDKDVRIRATIRPMFISYLAKRGLVRIGDTGSTGIADDHLVKLFSEIGKNEDLLLVTQDRLLSERIVELAHQMTGLQKPERRSFLQRLVKKVPEPSKGHSMVVCKLIENGVLRRCYVCPECKESYYDVFSDCDGMVPCSKCVLLLKAKEEKQQEKTVPVVPEPVKKEVPLVSVGSRIQRKHHAMGLGLLIFFILLILVILLLL